MVFCVKCRKHVCRDKAKYYNPPLNRMCDDCREKELNKIMKEK